MATSVVDESQQGASNALGRSTSTTTATTTAGAGGVDTAITSSTSTLGTSVSSSLGLSGSSTTSGSSKLWPYGILINSPTKAKSAAANYSQKRRKKKRVRYADNLPVYKSPEPGLGRYFPKDAPRRPDPDDLASANTRGTLAHVNSFYLSVNLLPSSGSSNAAATASPTSATSASSSTTKPSLSGFSSVSSSSLTLPRSGNVTPPLSPGGSASPAPSNGASPVAPSGSNANKLHMLLMANSAHSSSASLPRPSDATQLSRTASIDRTAPETPTSVDRARFNLNLSSILASVAHEQGTTATPLSASSTANFLGIAQLQQQASSAGGLMMTPKSASYLSPRGTELLETYPKPERDFIEPSLAVSSRVHGGSIRYSTIIQPQPSMRYHRDVQLSPRSAKVARFSMVHREEDDTSAAAAALSSAQLPSISGSRRVNIMGDTRSPRQLAAAAASSVLSVFSVAGGSGSSSSSATAGAAGAVASPDEQQQAVPVMTSAINRQLLLRQQLSRYESAMTQQRIEGKDEVPDLIDATAQSLLLSAIPAHLIAVQQSELLLATVGGPYYDESLRTYKHLVASRSISTYPVIPGLGRAGDPICDFYYLRLFEHSTIVALSDGCNWGEPPKRAAQAAAQAFVRYLQDRLHVFNDTNVVAYHILRAISAAQSSIVKGFEDIWQAGTATLLGGMLFPLLEAVPDPHTISSTTSGSAKKPRDRERTRSSSDAAAQAKLSASAAAAAAAAAAASNSQTEPASSVPPSVLPPGATASPSRKPRKLPKELEQRNKRGISMPSIFGDDAVAKPPSSSTSPASPSLASSDPAALLAGTSASTLSSSTDGTPSDADASKLATLSPTPSRKQSSSLATSSPVSSPHRRRRKSPTDSDSSDTDGKANGSSSSRKHTSSSSSASSSLSESGAPSSSDGSKKRSSGGSSSSSGSSSSRKRRNSRNGADALLSPSTGSPCASPSPPPSSNKKQWGFVFGSIGDCKAFLISSTHGTVIDMTDSNRAGVMNAKDPGGRLGPYLDGALPDLRNLSLYYRPCEEGDIIVFLSDGVHDNFDPQLLGKTPHDLGVENVLDWRLLDREVGERLKTSYRERKMLEVIAPNGEQLGSLTVSEINDRIIQYCIDLTQLSRTYMETNPGLELPEDYVSYPGKMDHTTCVCLAVHQRDLASSRLFLSTEK